MKLLIVDDEAWTREGLMQSVAWEKLGITSIYEADDGLNGLDAALKHKPEIILCDIRMPRMNGIQMMERLQDILPDCVAIFMSGYSDKEYLKAAIKLKAVNYVEKPLNINEVQDAITEAVSLYRKNQLTKRSQTWQYQESTSKLAMQLTLPYDKNQETISRLCGQLSLEKPDSLYFTAFLIKVVKEDLLDNDAFFLFLEQLNEFLASYQYSSIMIEKYQSYMVFFLYGKEKLAIRDLNTVYSYFQQRMSAYGTYFMCCGKTVHGLSKAYLSYENAVILMQSSFFFDTDTVLTPEIVESKKENRNISFSFQDCLTDFSEALTVKSQEKCQQILNGLCSYFYENTNLLSDQAKDIYYKLFSALLDTCQKLRITLSNDQLSGSTPIISYLDQFYSYKALHNALVTSVNQFLSQAENDNEEHTTVYLIKKYIDENYALESLSVKDISTHVYMSVSYICTLFKAETGKTLNQYITEYRIEKAKKLLLDPRFKITDISSRVGYSDRNYFGKSFKKSVGLSPSEYREKMLQ